MLTLYRELFEANLSRFNWGGLDGIEGCDDVQTVGPFAFWLLAQQGDEWREESFYIDAMLKAFPMLPMSAPANSFLGPDKEVALALKLRLFSLCEWLGLTERRRKKSQRIGLDDDGKMRRTPLFECLFKVVDTAAPDAG